MLFAVIFCVKFATSALLFPVLPVTLPINERSFSMPVKLVGLMTTVGIPYPLSVESKVLFSRELAKTISGLRETIFSMLGELNPPTFVILTAAGG